VTRLLPLVLLCALAGCAPVRAWERGAHAHRCHRWEPSPVERGLRQHALDVREGKPATGGAAGSGCGCG